LGGFQTLYSTKTVEGIGGGTKVDVVFRGRWGVPNRGVHNLGGFNAT
jgi:hypothetical protein